MLKHIQRTGKVITARGMRKSAVRCGGNVNVKMEEGNRKGGAKKKKKKKVR